MTLLRKWFGAVSSPWFPAPRAGWVRLKTERYARATVGGPARLSTEVTVGVSYEPGENVDNLIAYAKDLAFRAASEGEDDHSRICEYVEFELEQEYPGRPFFVETDIAGVGVQVYQPYGMPSAAP